MAQLEVDLVAADRKVWSGSARLVSAPAADGDVGILVGHAPLLAVLRPGHVKIHRTGAADVDVAVSGGFISVDDNAITIVVDSAKLDVSILPAAH
ncbi:ATP synthase F1 subcomplex epsilon subunit [Sanguibacter gelidistatuariae]|uniref:ATP synthase epsilon chain n=1 Tax=Sanguibacter gelidistatuariae TaxID=1814289 RepID=A0A1G6VL58_9MICO|nr:F0F1 ATP synthase subunit epsilon [Sanguibacter gelidistatuariae]SDD54133.1 ATP synthase F1 subcomplex epsilon subunit [Sanguibacter gelidistatuariae]